MSACKGCGTAIEQPHVGRRLWCSEKCRKRTSYGKPCPECGALMDGSQGRNVGPKRCAECDQTRNADRNRKIVDLYNAGATTGEVARHLGLSEYQVRGCIEHRRRAGEQVEMHRAQNRSRWPEIGAMWVAGMSSPEIAAELDITPYNVLKQVRTMRRVGIDLPKRHRSAAA